MSFLASCHAVAPDFACDHTDLLVYLVPSAALAFLIGLLAGATLGVTLPMTISCFCVFTNTVWGEGYLFTSSAGDNRL